MKWIPGMEWSGKIIWKVKGIEVINTNSRSKENEWIFVRRVQSPLNSDAKGNRNMLSMYIYFIIKPDKIKRNFNKLGER